MADEETKGQINEDQEMKEEEVEEKKPEEEVKAKEEEEEEEEEKTKDEDDEGGKDDEEQNEDDDDEVEEEGAEEKEESDKDKEDEVPVKEEEAKEEKKKKKKEAKEESTTEEVKAVPKDPGVPLYDQPLEKSGKRDRKKVERFVQEIKKEEIDVTGSGVAFGDIPFIAAMITKMPMEELKVLHRVAYSRPGSGVEVKKNLRKFNGYPFKKEDKKYNAKLSNVERILLSEIKKMLKILGLERSGTKGETVERLLAFMLKPQDNGKKPPLDSMTPKRPRKGPKKKLNSGTSAADSASSASDSSDEDEGEKDKEEEAKKAGRRKSKGTPRGRGGGGGRGRGAKRARPTPVSDDSESDDEPLAKKAAKQPPSDPELKVMVKKILEGANLEEVTMKSVCRQVYESYPDFDLTHKKLFIKETVKSIIS